MSHETKHPGKVIAPPMANPYPAGPRFIHNTKSKRPPVVRTVLEDKDLSWQANERN
jgi:hypothetical protein